MLCFGPGWSAIAGHTLTERDEDGEHPLFPQSRVCRPVPWRFVDFQLFAASTATLPLISLYNIIIHFFVSVVSTQLNTSSIRLLK